jgi:threonine aldolase
MRQSGYLAAAGIYALQNNINRLEEDHVRATELGKQLEQCSWVKVVEPIETNIIVFSPVDSVSDQQIMDKLKQKGIAISLMSKGKLRIVTHLDYRNIMHEYVLETLRRMEF